MARYRYYAALLLYCLLGLTGEAFAQQCPPEPVRVDYGCNGAPDTCTQGEAWEACQAYAPPFEEYRNCNNPNPGTAICEEAAAPTKAVMLFYKGVVQSAFIWQTACEDLEPTSTPDPTVGDGGYFCEAGCLWQEHENTGGGGGFTQHAVGVVCDECQGEDCEEPPCEGEDCEEPPCEGPDCEEPPCEGPDCEEPPCEGPDCEEPPCEGPDCEEPPCEGPDCEGGEEPCEGEDCNPGTGPGPGPGPEEPCEGEDCEEPCEGEDCEEEPPGGGCEPGDDDCDDPDPEEPCEGEDCEEPCEGEDCEGGGGEGPGEPGGPGGLCDPETEECFCQENPTHPLCDNEMGPYCRHYPTHPACTDFCAQNPDECTGGGNCDPEIEDCGTTCDPETEECGEGTASGGFHCNSPPHCAGDAIGCMIVRQTWHTRCEIERLRMQQGRREEVGTPPAVEGNPVTRYESQQVGTGLLDQSGLGLGGACTDNISVAVMGATIEIPIVWCDLLVWMGYLVMASGFYVSARILGGA